MSEKDETPVIIYNDAMYGASEQETAPKQPTATIPCALIGGSILVVLVICLTVGWFALQAVR